MKSMSLLNKNTIPNLIAILLILVSFSLSGKAHELVLNIGLFALSGALTNWIAIHMLFERVPGFYGSGVIALHFDEFKSGIKNLVSQHLFKQETVDAALSNNSDADIDLRAVIDGLDLDAAFDQLKNMIMESSFGAMLGMVGGAQALEPMRQPFVERMHNFLVDTTKSPRFQEVVNKQLSGITRSDQFREKIMLVVESRLAELTPEMVRDIVQEMIRKHLGWLVVWGAVFGGIIGAVSTVLLSSG